ncbi:hypothetical protein BJ165DRAFT_767903 [Panaeolus papilionaceus]|nr:hypothetical protein BJ165DRAFT_767903 [Panaeolus papilionaceus]
MPLRLKLSTNKDIESKNCARAKKTMVHILNPLACSESALFITINDEEFESLILPAVATSYADVMPTYLTEKLARLCVEREKGNKQDKEKRRRDGPAKDTLTDHASILAARKAKRRCMDGDTLVDCQTLKPSCLHFPDIMFETEVEFPIPLCCFTHEILRRIIDEEASLPLKRGFARLGNDKGPQIIDIEKLLARWNIKDESLDYAQYLQASSQMYYFYGGGTRDGAWATNWRNHFAFFEEQNQ